MCAESRTNSPSLQRGPTENSLQRCPSHSNTADETRGNGASRKGCIHSQELLQQQKQEQEEESQGPPLSSAQEESLAFFSEKLPYRTEGSVEVSSARCQNPPGKETTREVPLSCEQAASVKGAFSEPSAQSSRARSRRSWRNKTDALSNGQSQCERMSTRSSCRQRINTPMNEALEVAAGSNSAFLIPKAIRHSRSFKMTATDDKNSSTLENAIAENIPSEARPSAQTELSTILQNQRFECQGPCDTALSDAPAVASAKKKPPRRKKTSELDATTEAGTSVKGSRAKSKKASATARASKASTLTSKVSASRSNLAVHAEQLSSSSLIQERPSQTAKTDVPDNSSQAFKEKVVTFDELKTSETKISEAAVERAQLFSAAAEACRELLVGDSSSIDLLSTEGLEDNALASSERDSAKSSEASPPAVNPQQIQILKQAVHLVRRAAEAECLEEVSPETVSTVEELTAQAVCTAALSGEFLPFRRKETLPSSPSCSQGEEACAISENYGDDDADDASFSSLLLAMPSASKLSTFGFHSSNQRDCQPPLKEETDYLTTFDSGAPGLFVPTHKFAFDGNAAAVAALSIHPAEASLAAAGTTDGRLYVIDLLGFRIEPLIKVPSETGQIRAPCESVAWLEAFGVVGVGSTDGEVTLVDPRIGKQVLSFRSQKGPVHNLQFLGPYVCVTASSEEAFVNFWDVRSASNCNVGKKGLCRWWSDGSVGTAISALQFDDGVCSFAISHDESVLAVSTSGGDVSISTLPLSPNACEPLLSFPSSTELTVYSSLQFTPNGRGLLVSGERQLSQRSRESTGLASTPVCELWDLHDTSVRSQMSVSFSFWKNIRRYCSSVESSPTQKAHPSAASGESASFYLPDELFPQVLAFHSTSNLRPIYAEAVSRGCMSNGPEGECREEGYVLFVNEAFSSHAAVSESGSSVEDSHLRKWAMESASTFDGSPGRGKSWPLRRFLCTLWRDRVVGVGGPPHLGGAMHLWDSETGFLCSSSVTAASQSKVASIAAHPQGAPLVVSGGQEGTRANAVLWAYFTVGQLQDLELVLS